MKINSFKRNKKGQAFSTFQLLIAAVVALALLGVLMSIIGNVNPVNDKVIDALKTGIKSQQNNPGSLGYTREVKISRSEDAIISSESIVESSGLHYSQAIFYKNDDNMFKIHLGESDDANLGYLLEINTTGSIKYKFGVVCHQSLDGLKSSINNMSSLIKSTGSMNWSDIIDYAHISGFSQESTICLVFPMRAG